MLSNAVKPLWYHVGVSFVTASEATSEWPSTLSINIHVCNAVFQRKTVFIAFSKLGQLSWYRDGAQAGHPGFGSQQEQQHIFLYSIVSRPPLAPTQPPTQYTMGNVGSTHMSSWQCTIKNRDFIFISSEQIFGHYELTNLAAFKGLKWSIICD
jgi:hypothetical protein